MSGFSRLSFALLLVGLVARADESRLLSSLRNGAGSSPQPTLPLRVPSPVPAAPPSAPPAVAAPIPTGKTAPIGVDQRATIQAAAQLIQAGKPEEAAALVEKVLGFYASRMRSKRQVYFSADSESEFLSTKSFYAVAPDVTVVWFDGSFADALHLSAFIESGRKNWMKALDVLEQELLVRPASAGAWVEKGYVLSAMARFDEAVPTLRRALDMMELLADTTPALRAKALRGLGFALVETGELDKARGMYEQSLAIEPDSQIAKAEMKYIEDLATQKTQGKAPPPK